MLFWQHVGPILDSRLDCECAHLEQLDVKGQMLKGWTLGQNYNKRKSDKSDIVKQKHITTTTATFDNDNEGQT